MKNQSSRDILRSETRQKKMWEYKHKHAEQAE